jgi:hypothetical protein
MGFIYGGFPETAWLAGMPLIQFFFKTHDVMGIPAS